MRCMLQRMCPRPLLLLAMLCAALFVCSGRHAPALQRVSSHACVGLQPNATLMSAATRPLS